MVRAKRPSKAEMRATLDAFVMTTNEAAADDPIPTLARESETTVRKPPALRVRAGSDVETDARRIADRHEVNAMNEKPKLTSRPPFAGVEGSLDKFSRLGIFRRGLTLAMLIDIAGSLADGVRCTDATLTAIEGAARRTEQHPNERIAKRSKALLEIIAQRRTQNAAAAPNGGRRQ